MVWSRSVYQRGPAYPTKRALPNLQMIPDSTVTINATYFLDLNPDGTLSWATSHSAVTNHLTLCTVTTDASANISTVTDTRPLVASLLPTMAGTLDLPALSGAMSMDSGSFTSDGAGNVTVKKLTANTGGVTVSAGGITVTGGNISFDGAKITSNGNGDLTANNVTVSATKNLFLGDTSHYMTASGQGASFSNISITNNDAAGNGRINVLVADAFYVRNTGNTIQHWFAANGDYTLQNVSPTIMSMQSGGVATGLTFKTWTGSAAVKPFSIGGQFNSALSWVDSSGNYNGPAACGIPVTRNGTASSVPIYTGTTTPSSPPTGSIWIKS